MNPAQQEGFILPDEYLLLERGSTQKHEYICGEILAMAGASRAHNLITGNLAQGLRNQLADQPCETYSSDMRVRTTPTDYTYPDVVVACGEMQFEDDELDTLLNPTLLIEVLSKTSEKTDRGEKFTNYRNLPSVQEILLVSQTQMRVEHYVRHSAEEWALHDITSPTATIQLKSIGCTLTMTELYARVQFPPPRHLRVVTEDD